MHILSAMLIPTLMVMKETVGALKQAGMRDSVKVIVDGAPVTQRFAYDIQVDGYAMDAAAAIDLAKKLIK
jgi:5-methyltetrahydrofolate--homocysteine methyltransferase